MYIAYQVNIGISVFLRVERRTKRHSVYCDANLCPVLWQVNPNEYMIVGCTSSSAGVQCKCFFRELYCKTLSVGLETPGQFARLPPWLPPRPFLHPFHDWMLSNTTQCRQMSLLVYKPPLRTRVSYTIATPTLTYISTVADSKGRRPVVEGWHTKKTIQFVRMGVLWPEIPGATPIAFCRRFIEVNIEQQKINTFTKGLWPRVCVGKYNPVIHILDFLSYLDYVRT